MRPDQHHTTIKSLLVRDIFRLCQLLYVFLGLDLQRLEQGGRGEVSIGRRADDGDDLEGSPGCLDSVERGFLLEVEESLSVGGRVGGNGSDNACSLSTRINSTRVESEVAYFIRQDTLHGQDPNLAVLGKRGMHFRTDERQTWNSRKLLDLAAGGGDALEGHIADRAMSAEENGVVFDCIQAIGDVLSDEAVCLAVPRIRVSLNRRVWCDSNVHSFGTESRSDHIDLLRPDVLRERFFRGITPFKHLHFDSRILLRSDTFTLLSVVVHARLSVFRRINRVPFAKLDFLERMEFVHLPADKGVIVRVHVGGDERSTPVNASSKRRTVRLTDSSESR